LDIAACLWPGFMVVISLYWIAQMRSDIVPGCPAIVTLTGSASAEEEQSYSSLPHLSKSSPILSSNGIELISLA
jgi:hypothetical protein